MNIINVELIETNEKQLICTSGSFVMGFKGDNNTTTIKFNVPNKFIQENAICVLISPDKSHQYSVPLTNFSFYNKQRSRRLELDFNVDGE